MCYLGVWWEYKHNAGEINCWIPGSSRHSHSMLHSRLYLSDSNYTGIYYGCQYGGGGVSVGYPPPSGCPPPSQFFLIDGCWYDGAGGGRGGRVHLGGQIGHSKCVLIEKG